MPCPWRFPAQRGRALGETHRMPSAIRILRSSTCERKRAPGLAVGPILTTTDDGATPSTGPVSPFVVIAMYVPAAGARRRTRNWHERETPSKKGAEATEKRPYKKGAMTNQHQPHFLRTSCTPPGCTARLRRLDGRFLRHLGGSCGLRARLLRCLDSPKQQRSATHTYGPALGQQ